VTVEGVGQLVIAWTFDSSTSMPYEVTTYPRKDTQLVQKVHFTRLPNKQASCKAIKTARK
jgi:hypothetical protein